MKTPGVCIAEKNGFPNSVVEVATAVPAFVGYTKQAINGDRSLLGQPWRISSMAEYERCFGGPPEPRFTVHQVAGSVTEPPPPDMAAAPGQDVGFELNGRRYRLGRKAGREGGRFLMHQAMRHFFQNGGGPCHVVSVGDHSAEIAAGDEQTGLIGGITALRQEQEPTLLVVPDAVLLSRADCTVVQAAMLEHCGLHMRSRFAILDVWGGERDRAGERGSCIDAFRADLGSRFLDFGAAYYPWLNTSLVQAGEMHHAVIGNPDELAALIAAECGLVNAAADDPSAPGLLHQTLMARSTLYRRLMDEARQMLNLMPPSAAIAGLYTLVDNTRGVWKAPANVGVAGAIAPAVTISADDQEDLNVTPGGKSINAIRGFVGEGTLVWGARTLDGNSLDWRYVNVRRTMIMLEQSCRLAIQAMAFEPNVSSTWLTIRSTIANFLTGIWQRGGLAGALPDDAFSVHVGLGETMTADDILEDILRVTVLVAISRPAEFIEISFQQQMQKA